MGLVSILGEDVIVGPVIQYMEKVLVKPGWSSLRQVSLKVTAIDLESTDYRDNERISQELQSLPDEYLRQLSKLESVASAFDYSYSVKNCTLRA